EETPVLRRGIDRLDHVGLVGPEHHLVVVLAQQVGERGAPGTGPDDGDLHWTSFFFPKVLGSVPARSRWMFFPCMAITASATVTAITSSGVFPAATIGMAMANASAATMLANDT